MIRLLETYNDNTAIQELLGPMRELKTLFDKIERSKTPSSTQYDKATGVTEITGSALSEMKPATFLAIKEKVSEIRNAYVK